MDEPKPWMAMVAENPGHSRWYIERFRTMAAAGHDLHGEARLIDAMVSRKARILDAGCGPGRVGGRLHELGHDVVGIDIDPQLIAAAQEDHPGPQWIVGDLATVDVRSVGVEPDFDVIVSAGNVITFVEAVSRRAVLANLAGMLADDGRLVVGFGTGRGYTFDDFGADAASAGLQFDLRLATWDLRPWTPESDFLVAVLRRQDIHTPEISLDESYNGFPRIEEAFKARLDESLDPRGPDALWEEFGKLSPVPGEVALDVGCGEGADAIELARRYGLHVRGVDPVRRHVDLASEAAREAGVTDRVAFTEGSAEQMDVESGTVDLIWTKEALMYADLGAAFREFRRVLRPGGRVFVYQVFTGALMSDPEAADFWRQGPGAHNVRADDLARAAEDAGFRLRFRTDFGSEWGEFAQEQSGAGGRRLVHAARLLRDPGRYVAEFGEANYRIMLGDSLWHVYRMIGKTHGAAFGFDR